MKENSQGNFFSVPVYFEVKSMNRSGVVRGSAVLVCNAWGDQPISIVWKQGHNKQIYSSMERFSIVEANTSTGLMNSLTISSVTRSDGGDYTCIASNKFGSAALEVKLSVFGERISISGAPF